MSHWTKEILKLVSCLVIIFGIFWLMITFVSY
jgi:hypothetical protein